MHVMQYGYSLVSLPEMRVDMHQENALVVIILH